MNINYTYVFEDEGALLKASSLLKNEVWLDIGNELKMGCIDHHHNDNYESTVYTLVNNLNYLGDIKSFVDSGNEDVTIHIHKSPDLDCILSVYLVNEYLVNGPEIFEEKYGENKKCRRIIDYVDMIDQGRNKCVDCATVYALYTMIDIYKNESREVDLKTLEKGLKLIDFACNLIMNEDDNSDKFDLFTSDVFAIFDAEYKNLFKEEYNNVIQGKENYEQTKKSGGIVYSTATLCKKDGSVGTVNSAIWKDIPKGDNEYIFARHEGYLLTVVPWAIKGQDGSNVTNAIVSLDPDSNIERYTIKSVAELVEQMEQIEEYKIYAETGNFRRDYSRPRDDKHMGDYPFKVTSNPWYCKPKEDLFASPRRGSILEYNDIVELINNNGNIVKHSCILRLEYQSGDVVDENVIISSNKDISQWKRDTIGTIQQDDANNAHYVVYAELDSSLICHNNTMLKSICANLIGSSYTDEKIGQYMFVDYHTCIFSNENYTILLTASYDNSVRQDALLSKLINVNEKDVLSNSKLVELVKKIYCQQKNLINYGERIGSIEEKRKREKIESIHNDMLEFSIRAQEDGVIYNQLERKLYNFIREEFHIEELYHSIMDEIMILAEESREQMVSKFNILSNFAVPFVLVATLFQAGIIRIEKPILEVNGYIPSLIGWLATIVIIVLLILIIAIIKPKKK